MPSLDRSLARTLQAVDGDGYRSQVDAVVWATVSAVIAEFPRSDNATGLGAHSRFEFSIGRRLSKSHNPASESVVGPDGQRSAH